MPASPTEPARDAAEDDRARQALELVARAEAHLAGGRFDQATHAATQAAALRVRLDVTLPALARTLEAQGDPIGALEAWGQARDAAPELAEASREMGALALRLGKHAVAENVLTQHLERWPASPEVVADLARAQSGQRAYERAQATLKAALEADPGHAVLWRTLGEVLAMQGRHAQAIVFFEEALRLDASSAAALDGLAEALMLGGGDEDRAVAAGEAAVTEATPAARPALMANHARRLLAMGRLEAGWEAFAQGVWPGETAAVSVRLAAPPLSAETVGQGRVLFIGEADVAEELLLARALPRVAADGASAMAAVHESWLALARRSFPDVVVVARKARVDAGRQLVTAELESPHVHGGELIGAWAPLSTLASLYAATPQAFEGAAPYLRADATRVAHWRERLAALGAGKNVGLLWRAPDAQARPWAAPSLPMLRQALDVPGVRLIGLQADDIQGERAWIRDTIGLPILDPPPELQLWDLDDVAAFAMALDVTLGPPDAGAIAAAACGAPTWLLSPPRHWMRLGAADYPWFPQARVITPDDPADWGPALGELHAALSALAAR